MKQSVLIYIVLALVLLIIVFKPKERFEMLVGADQQLKEAQDIFLYELANPKNYELKSTWGAPEPNESYLDKYYVTEPSQRGDGAIGNMLKYQQKFLIDQEFPRNYVAKSNYRTSGNPGAVDDLLDVQSLYLNKDF
jgi:hypothetical protein